MVVNVRITGYTGLVAPPVAVVAQAQQQAEPKGGHKPALRLVK